MLSQLSLVLHVTKHALPADYRPRVNSVSKVMVSLIRLGLQLLLHKERA